MRCPECGGARTSAIRRAAYIDAAIDGDPLDHQGDVVDCHPELRPTRRCESCSFAWIEFSSDPDHTRLSRFEWAAEDVAVIHEPGEA